MIRTLLWKEYREQRSTVFALVALAVGVPIFVQLFLEQSDAAATPFAGLALLFAWLAGLVVGGQAFANETEQGTQTWLDSQPALRRPIAWTKVVFSLLVVAAMAAVLLALGTAAGWMRPLNLVETFAFTMLFGLNGLGCGLLGSTFGRSALAAIGWGLALQLFVFGIPVVALWLTGRGPELERQWTIPIFLLASIPLSFGIALRRYTALDRTRRRPAKLRPGETSWRVLAWLVWRQTRVIAAVIVAAGLLAVFAFPIGRGQPIWPAIGLALGLAAGVGTFAPDRTGDAFRFIGDRRLPPGRVWLAKTIVGLVLALVPALMQLAAVGAMTVVPWLEGATVHDHQRLAQEVWPLVRLEYLFLGPIYGFAIGQLLGMICRKAAVALVLSALVGAAVLIAWGPSCIIGGLHFWQWIAPPLILIATTFCLIRPWASGRLTEMSVVLRTVGAGVAAAALAIAGVAYRAIEVPDRGVPFDVAAFEASLPTPEQNRPMLRLAAILRKFHEEILEKRTPTAIDRDGNAVLPWHIAADRLTGSEIEANPELRQRLEEFAGSPLAAELRATIADAIGNAGLSSAAGFRENYRLLHSANVVSNLLRARARQLTARGDVRPALAEMEQSLRLGQVLQRKADSPTFISGAIIERLAVESLVTLAESPDATAELLAEALAGLVARDRSAPELGDALKNDYLSLLQTAKTGEIDPSAPPGGEWNLYRAAATVPWEMARSIDILNARIAGYLRTANATYPDAMRRIDAGIEKAGDHRPLFLAWTPPGEPGPGSVSAMRTMRDLERNSIWRQGGFYGAQLFTVDMANRVTRRAAILQLALAIHERRHGKPAATLVELTPDILTELPSDPYSLRQFLYRISSGERIDMAPNEFRDPSVVVPEVPAGQGVIWSVGGDMLDDGGLFNHASYWGNIRYRPGRDIIFLVPQVRKPPAL